MKKYFLFLSLIGAVTSCDQPGVMGAASCPSAPVSVLRVSYQEAQGEYLVFHTASSGPKQLANPLRIHDLQMMQISKTNGSDADFARMNFKVGEGKCNPILEMTQGFKIELQQAGNGSSQMAQGGSSGGGSYWAPFLMGAVAGHLLSGSHSGPAYYLPPPAGSYAPHGVVTGGVSAKSSDELNRKYESEYKQSPAKKGFFSRSNSSTVSAAPEPKKSGFFSGSSGRSRSGGSFFRKK